MYNSFDAEIHVEESGNFAAYNDQRELENELGFYGVVEAMEQLDCGPVSFTFLEE